MVDLSREKKKNLMVGNCILYIGLVNLLYGIGFQNSKYGVSLRALASDLIPLLSYREEVNMVLDLLMQSVEYL